MIMSRGRLVSLIGKVHDDAAEETLYQTPAKGSTLSLTSTVENIL